MREPCCREYRKSCRHRYLQTQQIRGPNKLIRMYRNQSPMVPMDGSGRRPQPVLLPPVAALHGLPTGRWVRVQTGPWAYLQEYIPSQQFLSLTAVFEATSSRKWAFARGLVQGSASSQGKVVLSLGSHRETISFHSTLLAPSISD